MGRIEQVLDAVGPLITAAINQAGITTAVGVYQGWPTPTQLGDVLAQGKAQISLFPLPGGRKLKPYGINYLYQTLTPVTLMFTAVNNVVTLSGTITAGLNVFLGVNETVANRTVLAGDTIASILAALLTQVLAVPGITATVSGASMTVNGAYRLTPNVVGQGTQAQEVMRWEQRVQVSIWTATPQFRSLLVDTIIPVIGNDVDPFLDLGDGSASRFSFTGAPEYKDESQLTKNVYVAHMLYSADYPILSSYPAYEVGETTQAIGVPIANITLNVGA